MFNLENYSRLLLGYKYALLRKEYLEPDSQNVKKKFSCFLMIGGADPFNLTLKITSILDNFEFSDPIAIVTGDAYLYQSELLKYKNVKLFKGIPSSKVFSLMQQSKFGILAASTVAIEACAARLPFICGYFIDNQKSIYEGILKSNLAICVDNYCEIDGEKIKTAIDKISTPEISTNIIQKQIEKLDKKSKKRFIKIFHEL
jgi:spore coat polysaccharide biosynthesis predicted glycosyltransferase SpsG